MTPRAHDLKGANVWYISPTIDLGVETVAPMILEELGDECIKHHKVQNYFELENGCKIYLKSANRQENLRGRALRGVIIDEISIMRPEIWDLIVRPMLVDYRAPALIIGTPVGRGKLWELYDAAQRDQSGEWRAFMFKTTDNPMIAPDELESASKAMTRAAFKQEFEANFTTGGGHIFKGAWLQPGGLKRGVVQMGVVFGTDQAFADNALAVSGTESAIVVVCAHPEGWTVIRAQTGYWSVSETVKRVFKLWKAHGPRFMAISGRDLKAARNVFRQYGKRFGNRGTPPRAYEVSDSEMVDRVKWALGEKLKDKRLWCVRGKPLQNLRNQMQDFPLEYSNSELVQALAYIDQLPQASFGPADRVRFRPIDLIAGY